MNVNDSRQITSSSILHQVIAETITACTAESVDFELSIPPDYLFMIHCALLQITGRLLYDYG